MSTLPSFINGLSYNELHELKGRIKMTDKFMPKHLEEIEVSEFEDFKFKKKGKFVGFDNDWYVVKIETIPKYYDNFLYARPISKLTLEQRQVSALIDIQDVVKVLCDNKYWLGAKEHKGCIQDMSDEDLMKEIRDECVDLMIYMAELERRKQNEKR
jgi:hypothetical protein